MNGYARLLTNFLTLNSDLLGMQNRCAGYFPCSAFSETPLDQFHRAQSAGAGSHSRLVWYLLLLHAIRRLHGTGWNRCSASRYLLHLISNYHIFLRHACTNYTFTLASCHSWSASRTHCPHYQKDGIRRMDVGK